MTTATISKRSGATYAGIEDTYFVEYSTTKYNAQPDFRIAGSSTFGRRHALLKFTSLGTDLVGPVTVNSVSLELTTTSDLSGAPVVNFYQVLVSNVIAESDWFQRLLTGPANWTNEGALGASDTSATLLGSISPVATYTPYTLTAANFRSLVEGWINGTITNNGMLLVASVDLDAAEPLVAFASSQGYNDYEFPQLTIDYTAGGAPTVTSVSSNSANEGTSIVHTVTLSGATAAIANYAASLAGGTATGGGTDYTSALASLTYSAGVTVSGGNLVVPSGVSSFTVTVPTASDVVTEGNETYTLTVGGVAGTGTIVDVPVFAPKSIRRHTGNRMIYG